ncbi:UNVERIFIED_CONTAM: hypothetical protein FKN15_071824 [Acipenser sinensis]
MALSHSTKHQHCTQTALESKGGHGSQSQHETSALHADSAGIKGRTWLSVTARNISTARRQRWNQREDMALSHSTKHQHCTQTALESKGGHGSQSQHETSALHADSAGIKGRTWLSVTARNISTARRQRWNQREDMALSHSTKHQHCTQTALESKGGHGSQSQHETSALHADSAGIKGRTWLSVTARNISTARRQRWNQREDMALSHSTKHQHCTQTALESKGGHGSQSQHDTHTHSVLHIE